MKNIKDTIKNGIKTGAKMLAIVPYLIGCIEQYSPTAEELEKAAWAEFNYGGVNVSALAEFEGLNTTDEKEKYERQVFRNGPNKEAYKIYMNSFDTNKEFTPLGKLILPDLNGDGKVGTSHLNYSKVF